MQLGLRARLHNGCLDAIWRVGQNQANGQGRKRAERDFPMNLDAQKLIIWAIIGIVAGWLASVVVGGGGGLLRYLITGLIGAFVGGFLLSAAGWRPNLGNAWLDEIVIAAIGAIVVVIIARLVV
jgi:uncharacterized membrane protein YeaQ/YmgE (transglycosylase-associated protein family)